MEREYELFEQLADGSPMWRGHASGLHEVQRQLRELTKTMKNECFAMHLPTKEIVARVNVHTTEGRKPLVFQITYDEKLANARSEVLKLHGYEVATVFGSGAARLDCTRIRIVTYLFSDMLLLKKSVARWLSG